MRLAVGVTDSGTLVLVVVDFDVAGVAVAVEGPVEVAGNCNDLVVVRTGLVKVPEMVLELRWSTFGEVTATMRRSLDGRAGRGRV